MLTRRSNDRCPRRRRPEIFISRERNANKRLPNSSFLGLFEYGSLFTHLAGWKEHNPSRNADLGRRSRPSEGNDSFSRRRTRDFFHGSYAYSDVDRSTNKYDYVDGEWKVQQKIALPLDFGLSEVVRCGDHDVATLVGFDSSRFEVLDEVPASKHDWLERIGVRKLFRKYSEPISITGSYGSCAFPLRRRANLQANGLARFDASGLQLFSFPDRGVSPGGDEIIFSKDGCYVLIPGTHLLAVQSPRCQ
jgi:hypothetical protein